MVHILVQGKLKLLVTLVIVDNLYINSIVNVLSIKINVLIKYLH